MNEIFGIPTTDIMTILVSAFVLCLAVAAWILLRNRVVFKLGVRNLPRRPSQTILIIIGLMLSTLIIAAAFTTGDTLNYSIKADALDLLGPADEFVVLSTDEEGEALGSTEGARVPEHVATQLEQQLATNPDVDGILPVLSKSVPVINRRTALREPALLMTGFDPARAGAFGGLEDLDGTPIDPAIYASGGIVLGESAAAELDAVVGDELLVYVENRAHLLIVKAIARDSPLTGMSSPGSVGGFAIPLLRAQTMLEEPFRLSYIAISNRGGVEDGVERTDSVLASLEVALEGTPYQAIPVKRDNLDAAEEAGNAFLSMFLVFGLFSISVGILLIFLIFVMLAAERKPEMGMARAVGMQRRQLTQMFLAEGIAYDLVSALVGAALGVGVAFIMAGALAQMFGEVVDIRPHTTWPSLIIAYTLGVTVTFLTILVSSWRISKLNISQAVRDTPEAPHVREGRNWLVLGVLGALGGVLLAWLGVNGDSAFPFYLGLSLLPLSLAGLLRRFGISARLLYSTVAMLLLLLCLLPDSVMERAVPGLTGGIEMFFLSGMMLVASATMLIVWNADAITAAVGLLGRAFSRWQPAVKTAVAYPLERKGRTGMTIAMFSLIVFSLVMMAAINTNIVALLSGKDAGGGWDIRASQAPTNPIADFRQVLAEQDVDVSPIEATARVVTMPVYLTQVRMTGDADWGTYAVNGMDPVFIEQSAIPLQTRAVGYATDAAVWEAVRANPDLAVIDALALPQSGISFGDAAFQLEGVTQDDESMAPMQVDIGDPATGTMRTVTIIGVIDAKAFTLSGIFMPQQTFDSLFPEPSSIDYYVRLSPGTDAGATARAIESALITYGVQADSIREIVDETMSTQRGFLRLFEGFMALGLVVGIAALGVIAFRSVVERRQQIGMLRAIGYRRSMVAASFVVESSLITMLGTFSGTLLGLALARNLTTSDYFLNASGHSFIVPWLDVSLFGSIALVASLLMAYVPARRASRVPIAKALRYE